MNSTLLLPQSGTNFKLYYLVPLSFVYLFSQFGDQTYLLFALIALIGAACRHAEGEAIYGPDGEEKRKLSNEEKIRRTGTMIHRGKEPFRYSATSSQEMLEEGEFHSKPWKLFMVVFALFQAAFLLLTVFVIHQFYIHRFNIDFIGAILIFSLSALLAYRLLKIILPNASRQDREIPEIDPVLQDTVDEFRYALKPEDISISGVYYEPATGGVFEIDCEVEYEYDEEVEEDINRIAVTFCSLVDRSSYPIDQADIHLKTSDDIVLEFQIDPRWSRRVLDGELSSDHYIRRVHRTVSVVSPDKEDVKKIKAL